jgi:hypothetical protein
MKTRQGFVSNSSSSSFCIYGCYITSRDEDFARICAVVSEKPEDHKSNLYELACCFNPKGLTVTPGQDGEYMVIGKSWASIGDDETGAAFKRKIRKELEDLLGFPIACQTHEDAWYNG